MMTKPKIVLLFLLLLEVRPIFGQVANIDTGAAERNQCNLLPGNVCTAETITFGPSGTVAAVTLPGSIIVLNVEWGGASKYVTGCPPTTAAVLAKLNDSGGHTWRLTEPGLRTWVVTGFHLCGFQAQASNAAETAGTTIVHTSYPGTPQESDSGVLTASGLDPVNPLDCSNFTLQQTTQDANWLSTSPCRATRSGDLRVGMRAWFYKIGNAGTGWTSYDSGYADSEYKVLGAAGTRTLNYSGSGNDLHLTMDAAFIPGPAISVIKPGGAGAANGSDWNNALADFPTTPACNTDYLVASGTYDYSSKTQTFAENCTSSTPTRIFKAVAGGPDNPEQIAGWNPRYGTGQAVYSQATLANSDTLSQAFLYFPGSFIYWDGVVPRGQLSGNIGNEGLQGFHLKSRNDNLKILTSSSFVYVTGHDIKVMHTEIDGMYLHPGYKVSACSGDGAHVTLTIAGGPTDFAVGTLVDVFYLSPNAYNENINSDGSRTISSLSTTQVVYRSTQTGACSTTNNGGLVALASAGPVALHVSTVRSPSNVTIQHNYIHDVMGGAMHVGPANSSVIDYSDNWAARCRVTPTQHANFIDGGTAQNTNIYDNYFEDVVGTGNITPTCGGSCTWTNTNVWNNVFFCTNAGLANYAFPPNAGQPWNTPLCQPSSVLSDDNGSNGWANSFIYGNTVVRQPTCYFYFLHRGVSTNVVTENNIMWCPGNSQVQINNPHGTEDYNEMIGVSFGGPAPGAHTKQVNTTVDPFVDSSDAGKNFALAIVGKNAPSGCTPGTNCYADGVALSSPYNVDITGVSRGGTNGWTRGAYQALAQPPTSCSAVGPTQTGTYHDGRDWSNLIAVSSLKGIGAARNTIYHFIGGTYTTNTGTAIGWQLNKALNGMPTITFRAATVADHGQNPSVCTNYLNMATGWNDAKTATPSNHVVFACSGCNFLGNTEGFRPATGRWTAGLGCEENCRVMARTR